MAVVTSIRSGVQVLILTAFGNRVPGRALSGVEKGHTFPVIWVCREVEWTAATAEGRNPDRFAVPADDVTLA
jgi:hypothetical protein